MPSLPALFRRIRETFWWRPAALVAAAVVLAEVFVITDRLLDTTSWSQGSAWQLGVEGSRGLLTAIGSSMLGVAATAFSITVAVIATASSSYGPRLVRNFMTDRSNQLVLGSFVATFVYSLLVLRSVRSADQDLGTDAFVPFLSVHTAILLALVDVGALVYFIHHIAESIQISTLAVRLREELTSVAQREYADPPRQARRDVDGAVAEARYQGHAVRATQAGFVVSVDRDRLVDVTARAGGLAVMDVGVGDHVIPGEPLMHSTAADEHDEALGECVGVGDARTPVQDARFAVQQLVEMAVRALSPGTNDPYTARNAIQELGAGLSVMVAAGSPPAGWADDDGRLRLVLDVPSPLDLADEALTDLRVHGSSEPYVVREILRLGERLTTAGDGEVGELVRTHIALVLDAFAESGCHADTVRLREIASSMALTRA
ncbi:Uncharacterized membrane protein [Pedococcus cremeus]|uniref:Uncharacterized membrane protein n=1 Tax=Pedococcus cremeus TaxID=587636 RepID=A0A1H9QHT6_9MICO|nr:DUF2254 domain-containing protein [Pedococcus cremeus]SER60014.1 Uncharacterized membrane protein [Pedococcus cremeus]